MYTLNHYSAHSFPIAVRNAVGGADRKPLRAFWLSVGDAWQDWCERNCFDIGSRFVRSVRLEASKTLVISSREDFDRFEDRYGFTYRCEILGSECTLIDWDDVAADWSAVLVRYRKTGMGSWTYGWDVDSACVLRSDAILEMGFPTPVEFRDKCWS